MNRRRILTGMVAAPFVARMGLLMPVRAIVPAKPYWRPLGYFEIGHGWIWNDDVSTEPMISAGSQLELDPETFPSLFNLMKKHSWVFDQVKEHIDPRSLSANNLRAEISFDQMDRVHSRPRRSDRVPQRPTTTVPAAGGQPDQGSGQRQPDAEWWPLGDDQ